MNIDIDVLEGSFKNKYGKKDKSHQYHLFREQALKIYGTVEISREQAKESGLIFYYGKACIHGHGNIRFTTNHACRTCQNENSLKYNLKKKGELYFEDSTLKAKKSIEDLKFEKELQSISEDYNYFGDEWVD